MNNKGFTLVEILAMLVVLGVLMAVTIPNITGILNKQKISITISDSEKLVESAKSTMVTKKDFVKPNVNECIVFTMNELDKNDDYGTGTNGGTYNKYASFVVVKRVEKSTKTTGYEYYVRLVELSDEKYYGVDLAKIESIQDENSGVIGEITNNCGSDDDNCSLKDADESVALNYVNSLSSGLCSTVNKLYVGPNR